MKRQVQTSEGTLCNLRTYIRIGLSKLFRQTQIRCMGILFDQKRGYRRASLFYAITCLVTIFAVVGMYSYYFDLIEGLPVAVANLLLITASMMIPVSFAIWLSNVHKRLLSLNSLLRFLFIPALNTSTDSFLCY